MIRMILFAYLLLLIAPTGASAQTAKMSAEIGTPFSEWRLETVVSDLEHPWAVTWLPDGRMLVTERPGRVVLISVQGQPAVPQRIEVQGVPAVLAQGQGGLLDITLHPRFSENNLVYFSYAAGTSDANRTTLGRGRLAENRLTEVQVLYQVPDAKSGLQHFGSRLAWMPDGTLLMSIGDGGNPPTKLGEDFIRNYAQDLSKAFGKILRFRDDGTPATDNPFVGKANYLPEIYSFGHRNIQGLYVDPATGEVWANEHGSRGGDELNLILRGRNYGWPQVSFSNEYWGPRVADVSTRADVQTPRLVWTPSIAPSGIARYTGNRFANWEGDLLSGGLAGQTLRRVQLRNGEVTAESILDIGKRVRDVRVGPDKQVYLLTDEPRGSLLRLVPK